MMNAIKLSLAILLLSFSLSISGRESSLQLSNPQNVFDYIKNPSQLVLPLKQQKIAFTHYLKRYYSVWNEKSSKIELRDFHRNLAETINYYKEHPGWAFNRHPIPKKWIDQIAKNSAIETFPNLNRIAITVKPCNLRALPTKKPSFKTLKQPGWHYPFDSWQVSFLSANLPIRVLHETRDKSYYFIETNYAEGWVKANEVAFVNDHFIRQWQKHNNYISFLSDKSTVTSDRQHFLYNARKGAISPLVGREGAYDKIAIAYPNFHQKALLKTAYVKRKETIKIPVIPTQKNFARLLDLFVSQPYGWGGLYGFRDCSATIRDALAFFGIWLPRNSSAQALNTGRVTDFKGMSNSKKLSTLLNKGIPFLTLVHTPGHIMLYIGKKGNQAYVLHDKWGLHTQRSGQPSGRLVIGKTVITPITYGANIENVKQSLLQSSLGMVIIDPSK